MCLFRFRPFIMLEKAMLKGLILRQIYLTAALFFCDVIPSQLPKTATTDLLFSLANMWTVFGRKFLQEAKVKRAKYADFCILENMFVHTGQFYSYASTKPVSLFQII